MIRVRSSVEQGSVLIVSLVILLVLTLLGIAGMDTTMMQERMAGNLQERMTAFQAAEAGLRDGEDDVRLNDYPVFSPSCTNGLCEPADPATAAYDVWWTTSLVYWDKDSASGDTNTRLFGDITNVDDLQNVSRQPAYIIEELSVVDRTSTIVVGGYGKSVAEWYRITARGFGRNSGQSSATVQSVFRK